MRELLAIPIAHLSMLSFSKQDQDALPFQVTFNLNVIKNNTKLSLRYELSNKFIPCDRWLKKKSSPTEISSSLFNTLSRKRFITEMFRCLSSEYNICREILYSLDLMTYETYQAYLEIQLGHR